MNDDIHVGHADVKPTASAHVAGIREGNEPGGYGKQRGHLSDGRSTAARSTGINPHARDPIDPDSPNLSPA